MKLLIALALTLTTLGTLGGCVVVPWGDGYHEHYYHGDRYDHHGDGYYPDGYRDRG